MYKETIFRFSARVEIDEVESTLFLSRLAAIALHGEERILAQADAVIDHGRRVCRIDTTRRAGESLALIFGGFVRREFGDGGVRVERVTRIAKVTRATGGAKAVPT